MAANVTSRVEWLSTLSPVNAAVPTEDTKYLRKVCPLAVLLLDVVDLRRWCI